MQHPMRRALTLMFPFLLLLAACNETARWHATDITGAMPPLAFKMTRANDGKAITAGDYRGKIVLLYFGYTHCPDICPTTLANLSDMLQQLGARAADVRVLFVTVDPNRDTQPVLRDYVKAFAPQIEGLRGSDDALVALARRYRVAYGVTPASGNNPYTVMHSDAVFFFDHSGRTRLVATATDDTHGLANDVGRLLDGN
jgi:protein SCO1